MATVLQIPRILQQYSQGRSELPLEGDTVQALLAALASDYPALYCCICDETGAVRRHINLFVNNTLARSRQALDTRLQPGDVVSVFQAVSGG